MARGQGNFSQPLSSASLHDSQAAIPLAAMSQQRIINLYDLMDSAYDAAPIKQYSQQLGHVPIIDTNPRRDKALKDELSRWKRNAVGGPVTRRPKSCVITNAAPPSGSTVD